MPFCIVSTRSAGTGGFALPRWAEIARLPSRLRPSDHSESWRSIDLALVAMDFMAACRKSASPEKPWDWRRFHWDSQNCFIVSALKARLLVASLVIPARPERRDRDTTIASEATMTGRMERLVLSQMEDF